MVINRFFNNYIFKPLIYLIVFISIFSLYELIDIDTKYINKPNISIDVNNVRNPQIKKIVRFIDNNFSYYYFKFSKTKQKEFFDQRQEEYINLPDVVKIKAPTKNFTVSNSLNFNNNENWTRSHGNQSSNKFSNLKQINLKNIDNLRLSWEFSFKEKGVIPGNPLSYNGKIFLSSTNKSIIALNVSDGKKIWEYKTEGMAAPRGLILNKEKDKQYLYFCDQLNLISLDANNGNENQRFGKNGKIKLKKKCHVTPTIINDQIIIATFEPGVEVYDIKNGDLKWKLYLKKKEKKFFRYGGKRYDYSGGNVWGGISADMERGIVYISTGNAGRFYAGVNRPGKNNYSNSVVAVDINKRKILWDFQEVEHDIWNYDIASPPILTSIKKENKKIDVVVVPTKFGNTLVLDRLSGKNMFDYDLVKVPLSKIPGEKNSFYQKKMDLPESFSKKYFKKEHISNLFPETEEYIKQVTDNATFGFFIPSSLDKKNIIYKGGAQWMGASVNNDNGIMYVTSNNIPAFIWLEKGEDEKAYYSYESHFKVIKDQYGYPGSKPPWGSISAINLNNGKLIWTKPFGEYEELTKKNIPITGTINYGGATGTKGNLIFATGTLDKKIRAFNSKTGDEVWNYKMKYTGSSPPTIFEYEGKQYVLVVATGSNSINDQFPDNHEFGNKIYAFSLK